MRRAERRRKFQEAVVGTLYPPSSPDQSDDEDEPVTTKAEIFDVELINPDDFLDAPPPPPDNDNDNDDGGGGGDSGFQKLSRAQRKRFRKRKLKEEATVRGNMIGPLLPSIDDENGSQGVRRNANQNLTHINQNPEEEDDRDNKKKQKQRRIAKKLGKEKCNSIENFNSVKPEGLEPCDELKMESSNAENGDEIFGSKMMNSEIQSFTSLGFTDFQIGL